MKQDIKTPLKVLLWLFVIIVVLIIIATIAVAIIYAKSMVYR